jgi:hypothetical protein
MFKRVEKRRRKKEEEEKLGLDDDMKEVLGMQDTDSDESDSDSDSESEREFDAGVEKASEGSEGSEEEGADGESSTPELSVEDALEDPVYLVSLELDTKACIVCPGKVLKHPKMIEVHKASGVCTSHGLPISK